MVGKPRLFRYTYQPHITPAGIVRCKWWKQDMQTQERTVQKRSLCYECEYLECGEKDCSVDIKLGKKKTEERDKKVNVDSTTNTGALTGYGFSGHNASVSCTNPWTNEINID